MALDIKLFDKMLVHGWVVMKDGKMSKSKGNVVYPRKLIDLYGMDALRYYLLREIPFCEDGVFTPEQYIERYNADLANDFGNLTHRSLSMLNKYFDGVVPVYKGQVNEFDAGIEAACDLAIKQFFEKMDDFDVTNAIASVFEFIAKANKYIDDSKPWALAKDENKRDELASVMSHLINVIYIYSVLLSPFLLDGCKQVLDMMNIPEEYRNYESIKKPFGQIQNIKIIEKPTPVYVRLDAQVELERAKKELFGE